MGTHLVGIAYIPALHKGYTQFFDALKEKGVAVLYIVSDELLKAHEELDYINRKDRLRALSEDELLRIVPALSGIETKLLTKDVAKELRSQDVQIMTPNEDISRFLAETYFSGLSVEYVDIFLRWHRDNTGEQEAVKEMRTITLSDFQKQVLQDIIAESKKSTDWWRQIAAALVKDEEVITMTHNEHMPEEQLPNIIGDTRALFKRGINVNYVTTAHAEAAVIAEAAKRGVSTDGAELYVTEFPCPYCARVIAKSGVKRVYFIKGYAVLEGDQFLKDEGVEVVRVEV